MSQSYEMMYILRPDLSEEQVEQEVTKYRNLLTDNGAEEIEIQKPIKRRLAYPIKRLLDGIYIQVNYKGDGKSIAPVERAMRLSDEVIRYLTIKQKERSLEQSSVSAPVREPQPAIPLPVREPQTAIASPVREPQPESAEE